MGDSEVVESIVAGDPDGLAAAYDRYADALYSYCRSLLREPADAADAVQDTFVIAASRLAGLRDPERLRAWLFAVARNECLRKLRSRAADAPFEEAAERADESVDVAGQAERSATRALIRAAVGGLNSGERDIISQLWHGLDVTEVAAVLGVSRNHAYSLFSRARDQLETSVGVLLVGRAGRRDCAALDTLLTGWDGRLTVLLRKRVARHIDKCPVCSDRRRRELRPAMLLSLSPGALVGLAVTHGAPAAPAAQAPPAIVAGPAAAPPARLPAGLRDQAVHLATGGDPDAAGYRSAVGSRHRPFRKNGFPEPPRAGRRGPLGRRRGQLTVAAGSGAIAAAAAVLATSGGTHHPWSGGSGPVSGGLASAPPPGALPPGTPPAGPRSGDGQRGTAAPGGTVTRPGSGLSGSRPGPAAVSASGLVTTAPAGGNPPPSRPAVTAGAPSPPAPGTLAVRPTSVVLTPLLGGTITLTANGGPVTWSISEPASLVGSLAVSPASGTLAAGQSVAVTITVHGLASVDTQLTVSPGGQRVTVLLGLL